MENVWSREVLVCAYVAFPEGCLNLLETFNITVIRPQIQLAVTEGQHLACQADGTGTCLRQLVMMFWPFSDGPISGQGERPGTSPFFSQQCLPLCN